jgi:hypothetical protein
MACAARHTHHAHKSSSLRGFVSDPFIFNSEKGREGSATGLVLSVSKQQPSRVPPSSDLAAPAAASAAAAAMGAQMSGMWDGVNKDVAALMSACHLPQAGQAQPGAAFGSPVATRSGGAPKSVRCALGGLARTQ